MKINKKNTFYYYLKHLFDEKDFNLLFNFKFFVFQISIKFKTVR